jgi:hypothetical protein
VSEEVGIGVFLVTMIVGRILNEKAMKLLSVEEKLNLIDAFSSMRAYSLIPIVFIIGGYWLLVKYSEIGDQILSIAYFGSLIMYLAVIHIYSYKVLFKFNYPERFIQAYTVFRVVSFVGIGILFYSIF